MALYHPNLVTHLFSICTPFFPPNRTYTPLRVLTRITIPYFTYQLQFASGVVEEAIQSRSEIRSLLNASYGGNPPDGSPVMVPERGLRLQGLDTFGPSPLLTEDELDYYAAEFSRSGLHGPFNWYRTREVNWEDEYAHFFRFGEVEHPPRVEQEVLFVLAKRDGALKSELAKAMVGRGDKALLPRLTRREIDGNHWVLLEKPEEVNKLLGEWIEEVVFMGKQEGLVVKGCNL